MAILAKVLIVNTNCNSGSYEFLQPSGLWPFRALSEGVNSRGGSEVSWQVSNLLGDCDATSARGDYSRSERLCPDVFACGLGARPGAVSGGAAVSRSENGGRGVARAGVRSGQAF